MVSLSVQVPATDCVTVASSGVLVIKRRQVPSNMSRTRNSFSTRADTTSQNKTNCTLIIKHVARYDTQPTSLHGSIGHPLSHCLNDCKSKLVPCIKTHRTPTNAQVTVATSLSPAGFATCKTKVLQFRNYVVATLALAGIKQLPLVEMKDPAVQGTENVDIQDLVLVTTRLRTQPNTQLGSCVQGWESGDASLTAIGLNNGLRLNTVRSKQDGQL